MNLFAIDDDQLLKLNKVALRLYTENRMDGDQMRDAAQVIDAIVTRVRQLAIPEDYTTAIVEVDALKTSVTDAMKRLTDLERRVNDGD